MSSGLRSRERNNISKLNPNKETPKLNPSESKKEQDNSIKEEREPEIQINIDKDVLEIDETQNLVNKKKKKLKKSNLDLLNEELEELIKKTLNNSEKEIKINNSSLKTTKKRKRKYKKEIEIDSDYELSDSFEKDKNEIYLFKNYGSKKKNNKNKSFEDTSEDSLDEEEIKEFLNKKSCQAKTLSKYKDLYIKKKNNKIIFLNEKDEDNYFKKKEEENKDKYHINININKESHNNNFKINVNQNKINFDNNKKHLKKLIKNSDNKEMELPLDAECIICCSTIKELANPDGCSHDFCKTCLIEWSQRSGKCPMCKQMYNNIYIYDNGIKKQISLNEIRKNYKKENNNENLEENNIDKICYICKKNNDFENLILCDRCKGSFCHFYCCNLNKMPQGKWYCEYCQQELKQIRENKKMIGHFIL